MLSSARRLGLALILALAPAATGLAQVIYENSTLYNGFFHAPGESYAQLITNTTSITSVTWWEGRFGADSDFATYIAEWDTGTNLPSTTPVQFGITTTFSGPNNFEGTITFTDTLTGLDSAKIYALLLTNVGANQTYAITDQDGTGGSGPALYFGVSAFRLPADLSSSTPLFEALSISVTGTTPGLAPVPEPKTAAAGLAAVFVTGLAARRLRRRRTATA